MRNARGYWSRRQDNFLQRDLGSARPETAFARREIPAQRGPTLGSGPKLDVVNTHISAAELALFFAAVPLSFHDVLRENSKRVHAEGLMDTMPLAGRLVLVVEDELIVATDLQHILRNAGAQVVIAGYLEAGLYISEHADVSAAVVDLHLGKGDGTTLCDRLHHLQIPFIVHTAYSADEIKERFPDVPIVHKPARHEQIIEALVAVLGPQSKAATRNKP